MHSDYYGIEFIKAYKLSRNEAIKNCLKKLEKIKNQKQITDTLFKFFIQNKSSKKEIMQYFLKLLKLWVLEFLINWKKIKYVASPVGTMGRWDFLPRVRLPGNN